MGFRSPADPHLDRHRHLHRRLRHRLTQRPRPTPPNALQPREHCRSSLHLPVHRGRERVLLVSATALRTGGVAAGDVRGGVLPAAVGKGAVFGDFRHHGGYDVECHQGESDGVSADDDVARGGIRGGLHVYHLGRQSDEGRGVEWKGSAGAGGRGLRTECDEPCVDE